MSIGLYDVDFFKYHQVMFNLEIMKMATYFKGQREITMLSPTYSPERYTHFYLRKDFYDGTFPSRLNSYDNLTYGGLAFTNNKYAPLQEEIERTIPDTYVYDKYTRYECANRAARKPFPRKNNCYGEKRCGSSRRNKT